jgi:hypothetical protein
VASEHSEAQLVELGPVMTAAPLETVTRAYRRTAATDADSARHGHSRRYVNFYWDDHGNLVGSFRLPADAGALLANAVSQLVSQAASPPPTRNTRPTPWGRPAPTPWPT